MGKRADQYLEDLKRQYIIEVKKFLEALKKNASQHELFPIRRDAKKIFNEIRSKSGANGNKGMFT